MSPILAHSCTLALLISIIELNQLPRSHVVLLPQSESCSSILLSEVNLSNNSNEMVKLIYECLELQIHTF